jgi:signal transduction histidine kinase
MECLPGPACVLNSVGQIFLINSELAELLSADPKSACGLKFEQLFGEEVWWFFSDRLDTVISVPKLPRFKMTIGKTEPVATLSWELRPLAIRGEARLDLFLLSGQSLAGVPVSPVTTQDGEVATLLAEIKRCAPGLVFLVEKELGEFSKRISATLKAHDIRSLLAHLHGLKGISQMVGLVTLAGRVHDLESELSPAPGQVRFQKGACDDTILTLSTNLLEIKRLFSVVHDLKSVTPGKESSNRVYSSIQALFTNYNQLMMARASRGARVAAERVNWAIRSAQLSPLTDLRDLLANQVETAAKATGKKVQIAWQSEAMPIDDDSRKALVEIFTHIGSNAVVHGMETAAERIAYGKSETGCVQATIRFNGTTLEGTISDDGKGIDPQVIKASALKKGTRTPAELDAMTEAELLDLVFDPGFSTQQEVTNLSGRGVGLEAVRLTLSKLGGAINIKSKVGEGTKFSFLFRPPSRMASGKSVLTYQALHNQVVAAVGFQAENERLPIYIKTKIENQSGIETGLVFTDQLHLIMVVTGVIGLLSANSTCEVVMHIGINGNVQLKVHLTPLTSPVTLPEQYLILNNTFQQWLRLNGGDVMKNGNDSVLIEVGGTIAADRLPLIELHSTPELAPEDFLSILLELRTAGKAMGFQVEPESEKLQSSSKLIVLGAYANYQAQPDQIVVRYMQLPAEIKSILITALENILNS